MSKKKKNKFKKSKHSGKPNLHNAPVMISAPIATEPASDVLPVESDQVEETEKAAEALAVEDNRYQYVRKDVRKLILSILGLFALMTIIYFLNQQFHFLQSLGDWIYKIANFQI